MTIRNPIEWGIDQLNLTGAALTTAGHAVGESQAQRSAPVPLVRRIGLADLKDAVARGLDDFGACRTDVVFLCLIYPVLGLLLARLAFGYEMLPLLFPLASGFALLGPFAAIGLYEMSRRRELGHRPALPNALGLVRSPAFGAIAAMGAVLVAIFLCWLGAAMGIYAATLGPKAPASLASFARDVLMTAPGWALIVVGVGTGFLFAVGVLTISVVTFPLLLDRDVTLGTAIGASVRVVRANPGTMAAWGLFVAGALVLGSIPLLFGLIVVLPVLGHATWHLYRKVIA